MRMKFQGIKLINNRCYNIDCCQNCDFFIAWEIPELEQFYLYAKQEAEYKILKHECI